MTRAPDRTWKWPDSQWLNAVSLAGELKIVEAMPALAKWVSVRTGGGMTTLSSESGLINSPAGTALVQIGDPAIPALQETLEHGELHTRWDSARALVLVNSPKAKAALREHSLRESDQSLAAYLEKAASGQE